MTQAQAIHILMLSPCYWLLDPPARKQLVLEYCATWEQCEQQHNRQSDAGGGDESD